MITIAWLAATEGNIDYINSFIEVYNDPLGYRGRMKELSRLKISICLKKWKLFQVMLNGLKTISLMPQHKKKNVVGVSYKTVIVAGESDDSHQVP
jgi:dipeptidyl-peptidase-3